jgi:hypothetical protein
MKPGPPRDEVLEGADFGFIIDTSVFLEGFRT